MTETLHWWALQRYYEDREETRVLYIVPEIDPRLERLACEVEVERIERDDLTWDPCSLTVTY